jgi:hypothetical protein
VIIKSNLMWKYNYTNCWHSLSQTNAVFWKAFTVVCVILCHAELPRDDVAADITTRSDSHHFINMLGKITKLIGNKDSNENKFTKKLRSYL